MSRRSKLIYLWSFNAILAAITVALGTLLLTGGGSPEHASVCAAPRSGTPESLLPVSDTFESIADAEVFICHNVAYPRSTPGWVTEHISALRSGPAAVVGRGQGFASITLDYMQLNNDDADLRIEVSPFRIDPVTYGIVDQVEIMGAEASLIQGLNERHYIMQWQADGFSFYVEAQLTEDFGLPQLYDILNSIR